MDHICITICIISLRESCTCAIFMFLVCHGKRLNFYVMSLVTFLIKEKVNNSLCLWGTEMMFALWKHLNPLGQKVWTVLHREFFMNCYPKKYKLDSDKNFLLLKGDRWRQAGDCYLYIIGVTSNCHFWISIMTLVFIDFIPKTCSSPMLVLYHESIMGITHLVCQGNFLMPARWYCIKHQV